MESDLFDINLQNNIKLLSLPLNHYIMHLIGYMYLETTKLMVLTRYNYY